MPSHSHYAISTRSEEVQELITRVPGWLVRWGTVLIVALVAGLILLSWIIRYPDIVPAPFRLTSVNAPKSILSHSDGRLVRLLVSNGQKVGAGQVLAYLESTANPEQVLKLDHELDLDWKLVRAGKLEAVNPDRFINYHQLGELQPGFQLFEQSLNELQAYLHGNYYSQKKALLEGELDDLGAMTSNLKQRQLLQSRDSQLAHEEFEMQRKLAEQRIIAPLDLKREESRQLGRTLPYQQTGAELIQNGSEQRAKRQQILELEKQVREYRLSFLQRLNTLRSAIDEWKKNYMITASIEGQVNFSMLLEENQFIANQQEIFTIAASNTGYFGVVNVPQHNFGKVKVGQAVLVKFAGYPYEQFGYVKGQIASISDVAMRDSIFLAKVTLPEGLFTTYHHKLSLKPGMAATAEIVTEDSRLLQRFLYRFRQVGQVR